MELAGLTAAAAAAAGQGHQQQQPQRACPRCNSNNTKFCYFNNYSLTQPRYFCKGCRRYWTHGGTLRNVPVGGSSRKSKRPRASSSSAAVPAATAPNSPQQPSAVTNSVPTASNSVMVPPNLFPFHGGVGGAAGGVGGGGFLSSLVVGQSMGLQAPVLQGRPDFRSFGRQDLSGGWHQSFNGAGGDGDARPAATGAQFWTLGGSVGGATSSAGAGEQAGCGSNPNQWRNFPAVTGGGDDDN